MSLSLTGTHGALPLAQTANKDYETKAKLNAQLNQGQKADTFVKFSGNDKYTRRNFLSKIGPATGAAFILSSNLSAKSAAPVTLTLLDKISALKTMVPNTFEQTEISKVINNLAVLKTGLSLDQIKEARENRSGFNISPEGKHTLSVITRFADKEWEIHQTFEFKSSTFENFIGRRFSDKTTFESELNDDIVSYEEYLVLNNIVGNVASPKQFYTLSTYSPDGGANLSDGKITAQYVDFVKQYESKIKVINLFEREAIIGPNDSPEKYWEGLVK